MNNALRKLLTAALLSAVVASPIQAQKPYSGVKTLPVTRSANRAVLSATTAASSLCASGYSVGFFNGVLTTTGDASRAVKEMERAYGTVAPNGEPVKYEPFYNKTYSALDFIETFAQRLEQHDAAVKDRFELFWEAIKGGGPISTRIISVLSSYSDLLTAYQQYLESKIPGVISQIINVSPTASDYAEHRTRLDQQILEGRKIILYAHSQGNLFANVAYDYATSKAEPNTVAAVHVAPASPTVRGNHTLAQLDLVINGLRAVGQVPSVTTDIPGYLLRPAGLNGKTDALGHGLLEIYMNPNLTPAQRIRGHMTDAFNSLQTPTQVAQSGFFTVTLTWNGTGDVDLHTFEPGGSHVYYAAPTGQVGQLDVDNTSANGPEHYFASCDPNIIQTGNYRIALNNYSGADGRTALVQVSSRDGVIASRSQVQGASQGSAGDANPPTLLTVIVSKDPTTGQYKIVTQ